MPATSVSLGVDKARKALLVDGRFKEMGMQFRVWERGPDGPRPAELLPTVYGGLYDRLLGRYVAPPSVIHEVPVTRAQVPFVTSTDKGIIREMLLGAPGAGKTFALGAIGARWTAERCNSTYGAVGATNDRRMILWKRLLAIFMPWGWVEDVVDRTKEIRLWNGVVWQVLAGTPPSQRSGSPIQGRDWSRAIVDEHQSISKESHQEIDARGRRAGKAYRVASSATNQTHLPEFRVDLERFKTQANHRIHRVAGKENPFVDPEFYENLRSRYSARDYEAIIEGKDVPPEAMVYHQFSYTHNVRPRFAHGVDITRKLTKKVLGKAYDFIAAQDFGVIVNATEILKAYECPETGEALWWVIDEIVSIRELTSTHARKVRGRYPSDGLIMIADPHVNSKDVDKSDYAQVRNEGIEIIRARDGKIPIEARVSMMNALLRDADGRSRLFIDVDSHGDARAPKLVQAFLTETREENGRTEGRKDLANDWSHYPCAVGYGLFRFEKLRARAHDSIKAIVI